MTGPRPVTVLCATRNARDAVRLTLASFRRRTCPVAAFLVADNGSDDGTLDDLRALDWITLWPLDARLDAERREREERAIRREAKLARSAPYLDRFPLEQRERVAAFLGLVPAAPEPDAGPPPTSHSAALDWLAARVTTPYFLTLDSDVEFLADGWLDAMLDEMERDRLAALGEYEAGRAGYRPRLAPHLLVLRTAAWRALGASFRPFVRIADPAEAARWRARPFSYNVDPSALADFPSGSFYPTGAGLFERLVAAGLPWSMLPARMAGTFAHLGHMSWAGSETGAETLRADHAALSDYVRGRLRNYGPWPP